MGPPASLSIVDIVSWQPVLTDHASHTLAALRAEAGGQMDVIVGAPALAERTAQGWVNRHADALAPQTLPQRGWLAEIRRRVRAPRDTVHLFGSPFDQPRLMLALFLAAFAGRRVFLISEPYSPVGVGYLSDESGLKARIKARLRPILYRLYGAVVGRRITGVFAISPLAERQYESMGVAKERVFPFGYFVPRDPRESGSAGVARSTRDLRLVFVGALIERKGVDLLIRAVRELRAEGASVSLDLYGAGRMEESTGDEGIAHRGSIPFGDAQATIARYDLLVLPSRYDGWGVVVNEAILAGVPVVASSNVGASALITQWRCGAVFASENVEDLKAKLRAFADRNLLGSARAATAPAAAALSPEAAGRYMYDVITGGRPAPPFLPASREHP